MKCLKFISLSTLLLASLSISSLSMANQELTSQGFIDIAAVRDISEIETAKIALTKSTTAEVKAYAEMVIAEQTAALESLKSLAKEQHLQMYGDAELQSKARVYIFQRNGKAFDPAYAEMRAIERKKAVSLFRAATELDNPAIKEYAKSSLPALMHHLYVAQMMVEHMDSDKEMLADNTI